jgi:hypothetical protein
MGSPRARHQNQTQNLVNGFFLRTWDEYSTHRRLWDKVEGEEAEGAVFATVTSMKTGIFHDVRVQKLQVRD